MQNVNMDWSFLYDRSPSLDDLKDLNGISSNDGRSETVTYFIAEEVTYESNERELQYKRLAKLNDGMYDKNRAPQNRAADSRRFAKTFCSQVELTSYQTERVLYILEQFDMSRKGPYSFEEVIIGIMTLAVEEDYRDLRTEESFQNIISELGIDGKRLRNIRNTLRKYSKELTL